MDDVGRKKTDYFRKTSTWPSLLNGWTWVVTCFTPIFGGAMGPYWWLYWPIFWDSGSHKIHQHVFLNGRREPKKNIIWSYLVGGFKWFQPHWTIWSSNWIISPSSRVEENKNPSEHGEKILKCGEKKLSVEDSVQEYDHSNSIQPQKISKETFCPCLQRQESGSTGAGQIFTKDRSRGVFFFFGGICWNQLKWVASINHLPHFCCSWISRRSWKWCLFVEFCPSSWTLRKHHDPRPWAPKKRKDHGDNNINRGRIQRAPGGVVQGNFKDSVWEDWGTLGND